MRDINYSVYDKLDKAEQVNYLVAWGIGRENAVTLVYSLNRPLVF